MDTTLLHQLPETLRAYGPLGPEAARLIAEEPALEIALPQVFDQPPLTALQRDKLPNVEWLVAKLARTHVEGQPLGSDYQALVNEFQPLLAWAVACWDFVLSTEGCRFVLRKGDEKLFCRGDFRAVTYQDFSRLAHRIFRQGVLDYAQTMPEASFASYLRSQFWDRLVAAYRELDTPPDPRQRALTAYSYLRCVPYQFLNPYHQTLVSSAVGALPAEEHRTLSSYFFHFFTLDATAEVVGRPADAVDAALKRSLLGFLVGQRLVYCLLRQIERY